MNTWQEAITNLQQACRDTFGVPVTYLPSGRSRPELAGRSFATTAILDESRQLTTLGGGPGLEVATPVTTLDLRLADLDVDPLEGDEVKVEQTVPSSTGVIPRRHI